MPLSEDFIALPNLVILDELHYEEVILQIISKCMPILMSGLETLFL